MKEITLRLDGVNEVPHILVDGQEIKNIVAIDFNWSSSDPYSYGKSFIRVEYIEENAVKSISIDRIGPPMRGGEENESRNPRESSHTGWLCKCCGQRKSDASFTKGIFQREDCP